MNHLITTYIDFIQIIGGLVIFGVAVYAVKQMLLRAQKRIEPVDVRVEDWLKDSILYVNKLRK